MRTAPATSLEAAVYALADSAEALEFIDILMRRDCPGTLAILMEDNSLPGTCVAVDGRYGGDHPDAVFPVMACVTRMCRLSPQFAGVVMASIRPEYPPDCDDIDRWFELVDDFDQLGVELLEWFVIGPDFAVGMRAMTGCVPAWKSAPDQ